MKKRLAILILSGILLLPGCADVEDMGKELVDQASNIAQAQDEHVLAVKNGSPNTYPYCTYGEAFDEYFRSPTWKYFEADDGSDVVEFTGYCMYQDQEVKARLQFILDMDAGTFETGALSFNDVAQANFVTMAMIETVFEEYEGSSVSSDVYVEDDLDTMSTATGGNDALNFPAWKPYGEEVSWYCQETGYYLIPFIDEFGDPCIAFTTENRMFEYAIISYVDCTGAKATANGGLVFEGTLSEASNDEGYMGKMKITWDGSGRLNQASVSASGDAKMFTGDYNYCAQVSY